MKFTGWSLAAALLAVTFSTTTLEAAAPRNVAIVLYDSVEILDFGGPAEVFAAAGNMAEESGTPLHVYTVAKSRTPLKAQGFISINPEFSIADAPQADVIIIPGGSIHNVLSDEAMMAWLKKSIDSSQVLLTVCTGAFAPGKLGYLDGLDVTTWYGAIEGLKREVPNARVQSGRRFIDNGRYVTTAGVSAGIDGALHVVARLLGRNIAERTAQYMEYHWSPEPYLAKKYAYLNPSATDSGRAIQMASIQASEGNSVAAMKTLQELVTANPNDSRAWYAYASAAHGQKNFAAAKDAFARAASDPDLRKRAYFNAACAAAQANDRAAAVAMLQKSVDAGLSEPGWITGDSDLADIQQEPAVRQIVARLTKESK
jgi:transcriptional regulator GlxA family with amidase domain